jgi:hypothetical protein
MLGMETPSRVREPDAYIPPAADAEHARTGRPHPRARDRMGAAAGLRDEGPAVDDATLERVPEP